jgi:hypothetical protein
MRAVELKLWQFFCDVCCQPVGAPVVAEREPHRLPEGWTTRGLSDCGLTGYSRTDAICPNCTKRIAEREASR